jgi:hypothetical protein
MSFRICEWSTFCRLAGMMVWHLVDALPHARELYFWRREGDSNAWCVFAFSRPEHPRYKKGFHHNCEGSEGLERCYAALSPMFEKLVALPTGLLVGFAHG